MSEKLPSISWREVIKILGRIGFSPIHQKGSHVYLTDGKHKITVPRHEVSRKDIDVDNSPSWAD